MFADNLLRGPASTVAAVAALTVIIAVVVAGLLPAQYEVDTSLRFRDYVPADEPASPPAGAADLAELYAQSARAVPTLARVVSRYELDQRPNQLRDAVSATAAGGIVTITARAQDPVRAANLANRVALELLTLRSRSLALEIEQFATAQLEAIDALLADANAALDLASQEEVASARNRIEELQELRDRVGRAASWGLLWPLRLPELATPTVRLADRPIAQVVLVATVAGLVCGYAAVRLRAVRGGLDAHGVAA